MTQLFLTIIERFRDDLGVFRYEHVSWPVYEDEGNHWYVKDVDGRWFSCPKEKALESNMPAYLDNLSMEENAWKKRNGNVRDFNKAYNERLGIDVSRNNRAEHSGGDFDVERKKEMINGKYFSGEETPNEGINRNLLIQP